MFSLGRKKWRGLTKKKCLVGQPLTGSEIFAEQLEFSLICGISVDQLKFPLLSGTSAEEPALFSVGELMIAFLRRAL